MLYISNIFLQKPFKRIQKHSVKCLTGGKEKGALINPL